LNYNSFLNFKKTRNSNNYSNFQFVKKILHIMWELSLRKILDYKKNPKIKHKIFIIKFKFITHYCLQEFFIFLVLPKSKAKYFLKHFGIMIRELMWNIYIDIIVRNYKKDEKLWWFIWIVYNYLTICKYIRSLLCFW
jgi:hypothetical protein